MNRKKIEEKVREVVSEEYSEEAARADGTALLVDLGFDSLDKVEFTMELESAFDVKISDENAERIQSINTAVYVIEELLRSGSAPLGINRRTEGYSHPNLAGAMPTRRKGDRGDDTRP